MRELFVYYRVVVSSQTRAREAVASMQRDLRLAHAGLQARLLERVDADGRVTWMETYAFAMESRPTGVDNEIEQDIAERARLLAPLIDGARHVEAFDDGRDG